MEIIFLPKADEDLEYWKQTNNTRIMKAYFFSAC